MKRCPYCFADIPSEARKCKHCGEWVESLTGITEQPKPLPEPFEERPLRKRASRYDFGEKAFLMGLLSFCLPPVVVIAFALGAAALIRRNPSDSPGWAIAGMVLAGIALLGWVAYVVTLILLGS